MKKLIVALLLIVFLPACCPVEAKADQDCPLKIWKQNENGKMETFCLVDSETGVNYIVVTGELYSESIGTAIIPRYTADGSLYISR